MLNRVPFLRALFPGHFEAPMRARRWAVALRADPALARDVIELGGILQMPLSLAPQSDDLNSRVDPCRLAFEAGQRDLAVKILALMGVTPDELNQLMEEEHDA